MLTNFPTGICTMATKTRIRPQGRQFDDTTKASNPKTGSEERPPTGQTLLSPNPLICDIDESDDLETALQSIERMDSRRSAALMADMRADARRGMIDADAVLRNTYLTNLADFLTEKGAISPKSGPAKRFADVLTMVVAEATALPSVQLSISHLDCFRRPGNVRCHGKIETAFDADGAILWGCPVCKSHGSIRNWEGTLWDCSADSTAH